MLPRLCLSTVFYFVVFCLAQPAQAQWELVHPEQEYQYLGDFLDTSGTRILVGGGQGRVDWSTGKISVNTGTRVSGKVERYGESGLWLWRDVNVIPAEGESYREFELYHIPDSAILDNEDFEQDDFRVEPPGGNLGMPRSLERVSDDGTLLLFYFPASEDDSQPAQNHLFKYDAETGWTHVSPDSGKILDIAGMSPSDLYAVIHEKDEDGDRYLLEQLTEDGFVVIAELDVNRQAEGDAIAVQPPSTGAPPEPPPISTPPPPPPFLPPVPPPGVIGPIVPRYFRDGQMHLTDKSVYIADSPRLYIADRQTGDLEVLFDLPSGDIVFAGQEDESQELFIYNNARMGFFDMGTGEYSEVETLPSRMRDFRFVVYDRSTGEWIFTYNNVSLARTGDFRDFDEVNRSQFEEEIVGMQVVDGVLYAATNSTIMTWDELENLEVVYRRDPNETGFFYSITYHEGVFYLGGIGCVYTTADLSSFETFESDALQTITVRPSEDGMIEYMRPARVSRLEIHNGAFWVILLSTVPVLDPVTTVLRSTDLENWTVVGEWENAIAGRTYDSPYILVGQSDRVHRIDTRTEAIELLLLPEGVRGIVSTFGRQRSWVAGRQDEILAFGKDELDRYRRVLLRYRDATGWKRIDQAFNGQDWAFAGVLDRYFITVDDLPFEALAVETIHGDHVLWTGEQVGTGNLTFFNGSVYSTGTGTEIWKRTFHPTETLLPDNQFLGDGWWLQDELGFLYYTDLPWVFSLNHGWWLFDTDESGGWRVFDSHYGWVQTSEDLFPEFYRFDEDDWLFYLKGSKHPDRWFFHHSDGAWKREPGD